MVVSTERNELSPLNQLHQHHSHNYQEPSSLDSSRVSRYSRTRAFFASGILLFSGVLFITRISNRNGQYKPSSILSADINTGISTDVNIHDIREDQGREREDKKISKHHAHIKKSECYKDKNYSKNTAKIAFELPFAALFKDTRGEKKFEASSLIKVEDAFYAVCDNSWAISKFDASLTPFSSSNVQIGDPNREAEDSGYEAILHYNQTFYVVRESIEHEGVLQKKDDNSISSSYHAIIEELVIDSDESDYQIKNQCRCEFEFQGDSKGFEGAFGMPGSDEEFYIVGLCEGNHCSESRKDDKGNGQMILMRKNATDPSNCFWETVKTIAIPKSAYFTDYSDIEVNSVGKVLITTQEDSALWVGQLVGVDNGVIDPDVIAFDETEHKIYGFPKSNECLTTYCNIEGITFINDDMVMTVSDQMKKKGKQPFWCLEKDQSIHAFVLS